MNEQINEAAEIEQISNDIISIRKYLEKEMLLKQDLIRKLASDADGLKKIIEEKNEEVAMLHSKLQEMQQASEGNRQIINKLLNDISHYQKDIDWYNRTYEKRSFLGLIKEFIQRKKS